MNCQFCTRRQFLKLTAAAGAMGLFQTGNIPVIFADNPPVLKLNVTARCLFAGVVATAENQKNLPNPYREEINYAFVMNDDCSGVNQGAESVLSGAADIGTLYRPLTHGEKAAGLVETKLDNLAYAVTVHRKNPVNDLTTRQVAEIFAGQIQNWKAVGGEDKDILIYRQKCGANYDYLIDQTIAAAGIEKNHARLKKAVMDVEITDNQFEKIAALDMAITMAPRFFFDVNCKPLRINGLLPTRNSEKNGEYPFLARISLVSRRDASRAVQTYLSL